jgi:hypothetical protein
MRTIATQLAPTPIPVQLSDSECTALHWLPLSMPKRGPQDKRGSRRVFHRMRWRRDTGMLWKCLPVPTDTHGNAAMHDTTVYTVFARWIYDGSLWQAFLAGVRHWEAEQHLDSSMPQGDGTNPVAQKAAMVGLLGLPTPEGRESDIFGQPRAMPCAVRGVPPRA